MFDTDVPNFSGMLMCLSKRFRTCYVWTQFKRSHFCSQSLVVCEMCVEIREGSRSIFWQSSFFCMLFEMWTDDVDAFLVHVDVALFGCLHIGVGALL